MNTKDMTKHVKDDMRTYTQAEVDSIKWNYENQIAALKDKDYDAEIAQIRNQIYAQYEDRINLLSAKILKLEKLRIEAMANE